MARTKMIKTTAPKLRGITTGQSVLWNNKNYLVMHVRPDQSKVSLYSGKHGNKTLSRKAVIAARIAYQRACRY